MDGKLHYPKNFNETDNYMLVRGKAWIPNDWKKPNICGSFLEILETLLHVLYEFIEKNYTTKGFWYGLANNKSEN